MFAIVDRSVICEPKSTTLLPNESTAPIPKLAPSAPPKDFSDVAMEETPSLVARCARLNSFTYCCASAVIAVFRVPIVLRAIN